MLTFTRLSIHRLTVFVTMTLRNKAIIGFMGGLVVSAVVGWRYGAAAYAAYQDHRDRAALAADSRTKEFFSDLAKVEEYQVKHPDDVQGYLSTGLVWKEFGEATGNQRYFERSRAAFERGVELFGDRNTVVLLNAGNMASQLKDYRRAEELYQQATRVNPGQSEPYLALVDLYRYHLPERGDRAIIDTYRTALTNVLLNSEIVHSLAFYLRDKHRYKDALPYFELLSLNAKDDPTYQQEMQVARDAIARGEDRSTGESIGR